MKRTEVAISTPCIRICAIDPASGLCRGCGRSVEEIAAWGGLDEPTRRRIMDVLPQRMAAAMAGADAGAPESA